VARTAVSTFPQPQPFTCNNNPSSTPNLCLSLKIPHWILRLPIMRSSIPLCDRSSAPDPPQAQSNSKHLKSSFSPCLSNSGPPNPTFLPMVGFVEIWAWKICLTLRPEIRFIETKELLWKIIQYVDKTMECMLPSARTIWSANLPTQSSHRARLSLN
jgi:hypothetical protein